MKKKPFKPSETSPTNVVYYNFENQSYWGMANLRDIHINIDIKNKSLEVWSTKEGVRYSRTFNVGDKAIHGQYNLIYVATITNITPQNIFFGDESKRMRLDEFIYRNYKYDFDKIREHNVDEMQYI